MFETDCRTTYHSGSPGAQTMCRRLPKTLCGGSNCDFVTEEERCHNKTVDRVMEVPRESCDISPNTVCRPRTGLSPYLDPVTQCRPVPRLTCSWGLVREEGARPVRTRWCYDPQEDSGLGRRGRLDQGQTPGQHLDLMALYEEHYQKMMKLVTLMF